MKFPILPGVQLNRQFHRLFINKQLENGCKPGKGTAAMFTTADSLSEILSSPGIKEWLHFLVLPDHFDFYKGLEDMPLRMAAYRGKTSWNSNLQGIGDQIVDAANLALELQNGSRQALHLHDWKEWKPAKDADLCDPQNTFLIAPARIAKEFEKETEKNEAENKTEKQSPKKPALIIAPGGGYEFVSFQNEGVPIQNLAEKKGYVPFIIRYRIAPQTFPAAQMDLLEAIRYIKEHADEWNVDPNRIAACGFSAGGHLAASSAALADELLPEGKPNALVLGYPVISMEKGTAHEGSVLALLGKDDAQMRQALSVENRITPDFPPTFAWACLDDGTVPADNTKRLEQALEKQGIKHECLYYPTGGHGCGLAYEKSAWPWSEEAFRFLDSCFK